MATDTTTPEPGIYHGVPFATYRTWDAVNASLLCDLAESSPYHVHDALNHPDESDTDPKKFGRLLHLALLEPATFTKSVRWLPDNAPRRPSDVQRNAKAPSESTQRSVAFWDAWEDDSRETITPAMGKMLTGMMASVRRNQCTEFVTGGEAEVCILWVDAKTGLKCKSRLDYLQEGGVLDYDRISDIKTTRRRAHERDFKKDIKGWKYHLKAAFYLDGWLAVNGDEAAWTWLVIEKKAPYVSKPWEMGDRTYRAGQRLYRGLLDMWAACLKANEFPDYGSKVEIIELDDYDLEQAGVHRFHLDGVEKPIESLGGAAGFAAEYGLEDEEESHD